MPQKFIQIQHLLADALAQQQAVILYKTPGSNFIILSCGNLVPVKTIPTSENGFVIFPFNRNNREGFFLKAEIQFPFSPPALPVPEMEFNFYQNNNEDEKNHFATEEEYCRMIEKGLEEIYKCNLQKVVLSRAKKIALPPKFELLNFYFRLINNYPNAFVYLISSPQTGSWIGATPELLFEKQGNEISTMALAGTIRNNHQQEKSVFTEKELKEQQIVTEYIKDTLNEYSDEIITEGPTIKEAGNISHLFTNFKAFIKPAKTGYFTEIPEKLHPTPAICGIPKEKALKFILENEDYDRSLYSGYLGPVSANGNVKLFVNLRCMNVFEESAVLYAGAGIVEGSVPEKEWQETEHKMNTLLQFIDN